MPLSNDEKTCLMIMQGGENLIRMKNTRWYGALNSLETAGFIKPIGNENFVITQAGLAALGEDRVEDDRQQSNLARAMIDHHNAKISLHEKMHTIVDRLVEAAKAASKATGQSEKDALRNIGHEVLERALEKIR